MFRDEHLRGQRDRATEANARTCPWRENASLSPKIVRQTRPARIVEEAVHGMLPKTTLGAAMYRKLKVYAGPDHPHVAQKPTSLEVA